jgi:hypothetical protein
MAALAALILGAGAAEAAPPSLRAAPMARVMPESPHSSGGRLDLRAPSDFGTARAASVCPSEPSASSSVPFPFVRRTSRNEPIEEQPIEEDSLANAGLRNTNLAMKNISRVEELTRRLHREGLPVARLWETRSAMVSLGLSPRGKPGIWLIQKIP